MELNPQVAGPLVVIFGIAILPAALVVPLLCYQYLPMLFGAAVSAAERVVHYLLIKSKNPPESSLELTSTTTSTNAVQHGKALLEKLSPFLKATLLQTLFIFIQALSFVGFYREGDWWAIVKRLLVDAFYLPHLAVDFRDFFAWPDFSLPTLEFKLTLAVSFVGIAVVAPYFRAVLSWCHSQSWFATGAGKPGRWEGRIMAVFAGLR